MALTGTFNVDRDMVTVSGMSGGAAFATQIHVALSGTIRGAAMFAGSKRRRAVQFQEMSESCKESD